MSISVLLPAAGKGERLGLGPKAFLPMGTSSMLELAMRAFSADFELIVAVSEEMLAHPVAKRLEVTPILGGQTRQETVYKLLQASRSDYVLVHDVARPFLSQAILHALVKAMKATGAATVAQSISDSLIHYQTGETLSRELYRAVQTPQGFRRDMLLEAHKHARKHAIPATDDAALVRLIGHEVALVTGSAWLNKITNAADYEMAKHLVRIWNEDKSLR